MVGVAPNEHRRFDLVGTNLSIGTVTNHRVASRTLDACESFPDRNRGGPCAECRLDFDRKERSHRNRVSVRAELPGRTGVPPKRKPCGQASTPRELRVVLRQENLLGHPKEIVSVSNQAPFTVAPRIAGHTVLLPNILVDIGNEIDLTDLNESYDSLQMSLDGVVYTETFSNPPAAPGEWFRMANSVIFRPHVGVELAPANPEVHAFRLVINGAETTPYFIELP